MPSQERDWSHPWSQHDYNSQFSQAGQQYYSPVAPSEQQRPSGLVFPQHELNHQYYSQSPYAPGPSTASSAFAHSAAGPSYHPSATTADYSIPSLSYSYGYQYPPQIQLQDLYQHPSARPSPPPLFIEPRPPVLLQSSGAQSFPPPSSIYSTTMSPDALYTRQDSRAQRPLAQTTSAFDRYEHHQEQQVNPMDDSAAGGKSTATSYQPYVLPSITPPSGPSSAPLERRSLSAGSPQLSERSVGSDEDRSERHDAVTPFVSKLSHMLNSPEYDDVIRWNRDGTAFTFAHGSPEFLTVLGSFFRHSNVHSFVRQLNIYAFTRLTSVDLVEALDGSPYATSGDYSGFYHPSLFRDSPGRTCDLTKIKPKIAKKPSRAKSNPQLAPDVRKHSIKTDGGKVSGAGSVKGRKMS